MGYQQAMEKAWQEVSGVAKDKNFSVRLLADNYSIDIENKTIVSDSCNIPAKEYTSIIILHYLARKLRLGSMPEPSGEWIDFRRLEGGEGYYPAFKKER